MPRPSLFIGSSSEGLEVARALSYQLNDTAEVTIWNEGVFEPGKETLESLVNAVDRFDFAAIVFTPDDFVHSRGEEVEAPRDNVMFELGLFIGQLGKARTFVVKSSKPVKIPSDLAGVTTLDYDAERSDGNIRAAVSAACVPIRESIRDLGVADSAGLKEVQETSSRLQENVQEAVRQLARARAYETELFLKYQGRMFINEDEKTRLKEDIASLQNIANEFGSEDNV